MTSNAFQLGFAREAIKQAVQLLREERITEALASLTLAHATLDAYEREREQAAIEAYVSLANLCGSLQP